MNTFSFSFTGYFQRYSFPLSKEKIIFHQHKRITFMKSRSLFFAAIILFAIVTSAVHTQPKIQLDKFKIELGAIYQGEIKNVKIAVTNAGNQPLTITNIQTSCGCTSAKKSVPTLAPMASDTIDVSFNSAGFDGKIAKTVTIQSNDPMTSFIDVTLTGTVTTELISVPKMPVLNFGTSPVGKKGSASFTFKNVSSEPITLLGVSSSDSDISSAIGMRTVKPSDTITVVVSFIPRSPSVVDNYFYIVTTSPRQPRVPFRFMYIGK
jgi:hypothetical protein